MINSHYTKELFPLALHGCGAWINWKYLPNGNKSPINEQGQATSYNNQANWLSLDDALKRANADDEVEVGISLTPEGLKVGDYYSWCFDFDGFSNGNEEDDGAMDFIKKLDTYTEASPSKTGFKIFFLSDKVPITIPKILFTPSKFAALHPDVKKYKDRAVEVFSKGRFLAMTGAGYFKKTPPLAYIPKAELDALLTELDQWAKSEGGVGIGKASTSISGFASNANSTPTILGNDNYSKLTDRGLKDVLAKINHHNEQVWSDVGNALARVYGESGRDYFIQWSKDGYGQGNYIGFDPIIVNKRYDRALLEVSGRSGYGCKHLCDLAGVAAVNQDWEPHLSAGDSIALQAMLNSESYRVPSQLSLLDQTSVEEISSRFTLRTVKELSALPPMDWRIKKILPKSGLAAIYGASGSGKSFFVIDILARVSLGMDFYGQRTVPCPVIYVCLEGASGISQRIQSWEKHHNKIIPDTFRVMTDSFSLMNHESQILGTVLEQQRLTNGIVVIDTLNQSAPTADENTSTDMGTIISNAMKLQRQTNSLVILVHHTGKDSSRGPRGHSSLLATLDMAIETKRTATGREWALTKVKDAEDFGKHEFCLTPVTLGVDADGEAITSCVAEPDRQAIFRRAAPKGKNQATALEALKRNTHIVGTTLTPIQAQEIVKAALTCASKNRAARAKEAIEGLIGSGHLEIENDAITIAP